MKASAYTTLVLVVLLASSNLLAFGMRIRHGRPSKVQLPVTSSHSKAPQFDLCPTCVSFTEQALDILLNIILNTGVVGSCGALCNALANKTGNKDLGVVCDLLCDYVGIKEFISIIEHADLDPIYFCELLHTCKVFDGGDATITSLKVHPSVGPRGSKFAIAFEWMTKNGTGTGQLVIEIKTIDGLPVGEGLLLLPTDPGSYHGSASLSTDNSGCDPTQGPCEQWMPGQYTVEMAICNGECGSQHPHSQIYDEKQTTFNLTAQAHP